MPMATGVRSNSSIPMSTGTGKPSSLSDKPYHTTSGTSSAPFSSTGVTLSLKLTAKYTPDIKGRNTSAWTAKTMYGDLNAGY